ncbi:MAG: hypothetical protein ACOC3W_00790 [Thermodesulfobacteriota bacterium]
MKQNHHKNGQTLERLVIGAVGGIVGTWSMTMAMKKAFDRLPSTERYPLPPREVTERITEPDGQKSTERSLAARTLAAHFAYGAATGAAFTGLGQHEKQPILRGMAWGVTVWAASYLGLFPSTRVLKPANQHPARRNKLMIGAHLVWGGSLGLVAETLSESLTPFRKDEWAVLQDRV